MSNDVLNVPAGHGKAFRRSAGQAVKLVNTHGTQVVDCWALNAYDLAEWQSNDCTRVANLRINPRCGDTLLTNLRRPILTIEADTSPGIHDTLMAACDRWRYERLGVVGYHRNCQDNFAEGLAEIGVTPSFKAPAPFNIFMNIPVGEDRNSLDFQPTACRPGDYVVLRAEMDCIVVFSACPQDIAPINGPGGAKPRDVHVHLMS
ncbi:MAG: urea carboxylase-associated family protein [Alphaproteobacteria bacterium]